MIKRVSALTIISVFTVLACAGVAGAAETTYSENTTLKLTGSDITLTILAGSKADDLYVTGTTFKVVVGANESFKIRYPSPNPGTLTNNDQATTQSCNLVNGNNDVTVVGPRTVTFTPTTSLCGAAAAGSGGSSGGGGSGGGGSSAPSPVAPPTAAPTPSVPPISTTPTPPLPKRTRR